MSWTNELYRVYELMIEATDEQIPLAPVAHDATTADIEITIDEHGNFKNAGIVSKEEKETIIPVYEDSGGRTSKKASPHPLNDKLKYLMRDNDGTFEQYLSNLEDWKDSKFTHRAVVAVYKYLAQSDIMRDLKQAGLIKESDNEKNKTKFVRFVISYDDLLIESRTWKDTSLQEAFKKYNATKFQELQLCYATGRFLPYTYKHPKIAGNAKIISSNDDKGFTFKGRFCDKKQAISVSYDFSQKMHNALKWLIKKQGQHFGTLTLVAWASALQPLPNEIQDGNIEDEWGEEETYDSLPEYRAWLSRYLMGYRQKFQNNTKVMVLGLEAAVPGRLAISLYDELQSSDFLHNLEDWHMNSACLRFDKRKGKSVVKSCSLYEIIRAAYGIENKKSGKIECDDKLFSNNILWLLPCVMKKQSLPQNLIQTLYHKASNPLSYEKKSNHHFVIEVACSMMRKKLKEKIEGVEFMAYDPNEKDRNYLYGCLLAIADRVEFGTYNERDRENRVTNARRYWLKFSQRPYQTWKIIEERLCPYINQYPCKTKIVIEEKIQEVTEKFTRREFEDNSRLNTLYLLGYHHFRAYMNKTILKEEI